MQEKALKPVLEKFKKKYANSNLLKPIDESKPIDKRRMNKQAALFYKQVEDRMKEFENSLKK